MGIVYNKGKRALVNKVLASSRRKKIIRHDFTIISNNCTAAWIYQSLGLKYSSPTIGLFFYSNDYIRFVENLHHYLQIPLEFVQKSKYYPNRNEAWKKKQYPIGCLDDVEIHFRHYQNEKEACDKWKRRIPRVNFENLFLVFSDINYFEPDFLERFERLSCQNKVFFSAKPLPNPMVVHVKEYDGQNMVGDSRYLYDKYFDTVAWLNCEPFKKK